MTFTSWQYSILSHIDMPGGSHTHSDSTREGQWKVCLQDTPCPPLMYLLADSNLYPFAV